MTIRCYYVLIFMVFQKSIILTEGIQKDSRKDEILENFKSLPESLTEIDQPALPSFGNFQTILINSSWQDNPYFKFLSSSDFINQFYEELEAIKSSVVNDEEWVLNIRNYADSAISYYSPSLWDHLNDFIHSIFPKPGDGGIFHKYSKYVMDMMKKNQWCEEKESLNHYIYSSFKFTLSMIRKVFSVMMQSYIVRNTFEGNLDDYINWLKKTYKDITKSMFIAFKRLATGTPTRIASCDPAVHVRNKTYLELEKLLQGILPPEITLNSANSAKGGCEDYSGHWGTKYHPYVGVRSDNDWKCHGLMYNCFEISPSIDICKPSTPNRRLDGYREDFKGWQMMVREYPPVGTGQMHQCFSNNIWRTKDWRWYLPSTLYISEQCACICDDFDHPKTLRRFSTEYAVSDYKNNMVVTGIRLVNISNVIHIQIQEGKLEKFGSINASTVQWRLKNDLVNNSESRSNVLQLSYHARRMNLDVLHSLPNEVILGAAFDWDPNVEGVSLSIFVSAFSFETGELEQTYRRHFATAKHREEIPLHGSSIPTYCSGNLRMNGNHRFVNFQTTDWQRDAAQTTIPYLDIQEVVTNPPAMLRGIGLYHKSAGKCGGFIGFELYSHKFEELMVNDDTLY